MINRKVYEDIIQWIGKDKILILKGARQVGKTTIMKKIQSQLEKEGKKTFFIFADDLSNKSLFETPDKFIYFLNFKFDIDKLDTKLYVFIDEFQYIDNAGLFLKNIFDKYKEKLQLIVSGSSSLEITKNTEFLTGRNIEFYIDRISYKEFLEYKFNKTLTFTFKDFDQIKQFYSVFKDELEKYFLEYISFGGYPEVITSNTEKEKMYILNSIYKNYIEKDIVAFLKITNITAFNNLVKILSSQIGNLLNKMELSNTLGISRITLDKYLDILKGTFIFYYLPPYFSNIRKELSKMPKVFGEDLGIINYILGRNLLLKDELNLGAIVENFVYKQLMYKDKFSKLYFYQTISKAEIDFVLENFDKTLSIFEVKYRKKVQVPNVFKKFEDKYSSLLLNKFIITKDILKYEKGVYFIPACVLI